MDVTHALQILIRGKNLAGPALKGAGVNVSSLVKTVLRAGAGLKALGAIGTKAIGVGLTGAVGAATSSFQGLVSVLGMAAKGALALGAAVATITSALVAGAAAAIPYATALEGMYDTMIGIAGDAAPAMLQSLRESSAFMVTERNLLKQHNMAYMLIGDTLSKRMPEAYEYLSKVARATGDKVDWLMERLTRSIGRLSTRWMAYLGTVVPIEEATARAAEMFGKEADALTYAEKQAGMLDRALAKLRARTAAMPEVLGTTTQLLAQAKAGFKDIWGEIGRHFLPVARSALEVVIKLQTGFRALISEGGALYVPIRKLAAAFSVLFDILGELIGRFDDVEKEATSKLEGFANRMIETAWKAIEWGAHIITNLAAGIIKGASYALTAAMNFVSSLLEWWLAPGSAPRIVSNILDWGASAFTEYLRGFSMAQFDVLEGVQRPLKRALKVLMNLELLSPVEMGETFIDLSGEMAAALEEFGRTGQVAGDIFERLAEVGGGYGESIAELFRRQLTLATAVERLAKAEERLTRARKAEEAAGVKLSKQAREYNKLVRAGADPAVLKAKLAEVKASYASLVAAREETVEAEEAKEAAEKAKKEAAERVKLQERLLNQLIEMGEAMADLAKARKKAAEEAEDGYVMPPIEWPDMYPVPLDEAFAALKESIRAKFEALWADIRQQWEESGVAKAIEDLGAAFDRLKAVAGPAWEWITDNVLTPFREWVAEDAWPWIVEQWEGWRRWWEEDAPIIKERLEEIGDAVSDWVDENVFEWALEEWRKWRLWWYAHGPEITSAFEILLATSGRLMEGFLNIFLVFLGTSTRELRDWAEVEWPDIWAIAEGSFGGFWKITQIMAEGGMKEIRLAISLGARLIHRDWEGAQIKLQQMISTGWDTLNRLSGERLAELGRIVQGYIDDPSTFQQAGRNLITRMIAGMTVAAVEWITRTREMISDVKDRISDEWKSFYRLGTDIVMAIGDGISDKANSLASIIRNVVNNAIQAAKNALGMRSPSRVFTEMGENLALAFAQGIDTMAATPAVAVGQMAMGAVGAAGGVTPGAGVGAGGATYYITNQFGTDSVRSDADVLAIADAQQRALELQGVRGRIM